MTDTSVADLLGNLNQETTQGAVKTAVQSIDGGIGGASAAAAGDTGASTTNGFLRWIRDFWLSLKGTKTAANSLSVTGASDAVFYVGGVSADGVAPTNQAVRVSGIDGGGLKRTLLTDSSGRQYVVAPDGDQYDITFNSAADTYIVDFKNYMSFSLQWTAGASGSNSLAFEIQDDSTSSTWTPVSVQAYSTVANRYTFRQGVGLSSYSQASGNKQARYMRIRPSVFGTGPIVCKLTLMSTTSVGSFGVIATGASPEGIAVSGNPILTGLESRTTSKTSVASGSAVGAIGTQDGRIVVRQNSIPENEWTYAAASGGILNTNAAVTIKAAAGSNVRNYVTSIQIMSEALTNATELAIRDGAAGTVLWRTKIGTGGLPLTTVRFDDPLRGTANTLLEVVTLTASGAGAVYFNAQGYIGP